MLHGVDLHRPNAARIHAALPQSAEDQIERFEQHERRGVPYGRKLAREYATFRAVPWKGGVIVEGVRMHNPGTMDVQDQRLDRLGTEVNSQGVEGVSSSFTFDHYAGSINVSIRLQQETCR